MFLTFVLVYVSVFACLSVYKCIVVHVFVWAQMRGCTVICELWSFKCLFMRFPNDEGSQFSKFHFPCSNGERWTLYSFFRECKVYSKTYQPAKNSLSCSQLFVTSLNCYFWEHNSIILLYKQIIVWNFDKSFWFSSCPN